MHPIPFCLFLFFFFILFELLIIFLKTEIQHASRHHHFRYHARSSRFERGAAQLQASGFGNTFASYDPNANSGGIAMSGSGGMAMSGGGGMVTSDSGGMTTRASRRIAMRRGGGMATNANDGGVANSATSSSGCAARTSRSSSRRHPPGPESRSRSRPMTRAPTSRTWVPRARRSATRSR